ncbi:MAG: glycosyltransferase, partial [Dehalococcoidia bacterium]
YHNITPSHFFTGYSDLHVSLASVGRARLADLIKTADLCLGDSRYNCLELEARGATDCRVLPPLVDFEALRRVRPDTAVLRRHGDGTPTILYVGRPIPNKRQDDVIRAFARYREAWSRSAHLILVGGSDEATRYQQDLHRMIKDLGLRRNVILTGLLSDEQLAAYYRVAHAFLSMSEHEGFGIPLLEAMSFDIPVLAYSAAAVPYTLGDAGILIKEKNFSAIAEILHRVMTDPHFKSQVLAGQRRRLTDFAPKEVTAMLKLYLDELLER